MELTFIYRFAGFHRKIRLKNSKNNLTKLQSDDKFDFLFLKWISQNFLSFFTALKSFYRKNHTSL